MLQANKAELIAKLALSTLNIRQLEIHYWIGVFDKFGVLAALLGGFASIVVMMDIDRRRDVPGLQLLYVLSAGGAFGFNMVLLVISVMVCMWGPGMALTGQGVESYEEVISLMEQMYEHCLNVFRAGLVCYFLTSFLSVFCLFNFIAALLITATLVYFGVFLIRYYKSLRLIFIPSVFSSGILRGNPVVNIGTEMTHEADPKLSGTTFSPSFATKI